MHPRPMKRIRRAALGLAWAAVMIFCAAHSMDATRAHSELPSSTSLSESLRQVTSESNREVGSADLSTAASTAELPEVTTELPEGIPPLPEPPSLPPEGF